FGEGRFGLGIRRTALSTALVERAREVGADIREGQGVRGWSRSAEAVQLQTDGGPVHARLLVAADGLNSSLRKEGGLERPSGLPARYGLRRHYALAPWTDRVEVYFGHDVEAYVTPVGERRIGVGFLWEKGSAQLSFEHLLERFPGLAERVGAAPFDSTVRGAGPLARTVPVLAQDRFVLLGDAAGYVDAITGEGLTLGLRAAAFLSGQLPSVLAQGATARSLAPYTKACASHFAPYSRMTRAMLWMARRPALRKQVIRAVGAVPWAFDQLLRRVA
ncbi:MAG: FAD-dependent monooxygenase, partial [Myxococcota bacterium]|nr:FAD-dependent monooxygenase [Myxococcota bacterium]